MDVLHPGILGDIILTSFVLNKIARSIGATTDRCVVTVD